MGPRDHAPVTSLRGMSDALRAGFRARCCGRFRHQRPDRRRRLTHGKAGSAPLAALTSLTRVVPSGWALASRDDTTRPLACAPHPPYT